MNSWFDARTREVRRFEYPDAGADPHGEQSDLGADASPSETETETSTAVAEAYEQGKRDGLAQAQTRADQELAKVHRQIHTVIDQFNEERHRYFMKIEAEVVQLSLAIARRVIEREVSSDDCLLGGMVRVALEQLDSNTRVRVRVHPDIAERWKARIAWTNADSLQWVPDSSLSGEVCRLETDLGSTEIGVELKLKEVEQSFLELLSCRSQVADPVVMQ